MAGGIHADFVACLLCGSRAERIAEGNRMDDYVCDDAHAFQIDWVHAGVPTEPQWPPSPALQAFLELVFNKKSA
jgi:hypothetical protein